MSPLKIMLLVVALVFQGGCGSTPPKQLQAAVLTQPSVATSSVLNAAASRALNGVRVSLARDALTQSSDMQIERMTQDPASARGLNGRLMGVPTVYRFSLKRRESDCFLVYEKTGQAYPLEGVSCKVSAAWIEKSKFLV